jgi:(p)ppGpp synthase/HD superfamily hydrolase
MLPDYTDDEDVIVAALLHDTIEDTDYTLAELEEDFGGRVREIVDTLSEPKEVNGLKLSWSDRKKNYAKQLKNGSKEAVLIAAVDKIHNFRTSVEEYYDEHNRFLTDFGKNLDERIEVYQIIANVINNRLDGAILNEFNHVFDEYKNFIYAIKQGQEVRF